jgi:hypothetical protein
MSIEVGTDESSGGIGLVESRVTPVEPPSPPSPVPAARRRPRWPLIVGLAIVVLVLALGGGAFAANASLSQTYSPQRAVADYFAAQQRGDVNAMWSHATYLHGDGSYERMFNQEGLRSMMKLPANSSISDVRIASTRQLDSARSLVGVSLVWKGVPRDLAFTVRKDPNVSHWLFYPSWKVEIPSSSINVTLPNQSGTILVDGIYPTPGTIQTSFKVIFGFHEVVMVETPFLDRASQQVDAVSDAAISVPGTISKSATTKAADAVKYAFAHCTGKGCFDHTYTAPDNKYDYYMSLPGYGDVFYTKYVITLTGDPTVTMKLAVQADRDKVSVSGPCTSTFTVNGTHQYPLAGNFNGTLTWTGGAFDSNLGWNCATAKG